jgi:hypothetical protein
MPNIYHERELAAQSLGFSSFARYMASPMWMEIRRAAWRRANGKCQCCGDRASQIHHLDYQEPTLRGKAPVKLKALCDGCHSAAEFENGVKLPIEEVNRRLEAWTADDGGKPSRGRRDSGAMARRIQLQDYQSRYRKSVRF